LSLAIKYESVEDASMRLRNTIVLYEGKPVFITGITAGTGDDILRVRFKELPLDPNKNFGGPFEDAEDGGKRKFISSKHFDISPFRLGYVNHPKYGAFYVQRLPHRIQKQGFSSESYAAKTNAGLVISWAVFTQSKETVAMINNDYPSFDRAKALLGKIPSVAFCRDYSLMKDEVLPELMFLYHKGQKVGFVNETGVTLGEKFKCLKESLSEVKVRAA
jgi:hypothetical protein